MTTQADRSPDTRDLGMSLEPGDRRRAQVDVLMPVPTTERLVRRAHTGEACEVCGNRAAFVLVTGPGEDDKGTCCLMTELSVHIRAGRAPCTHRNDMNESAPRRGFSLVSER